MMLDDFFNYNWPSPRSLTRDTFKIDVQENDNEYVIEAELPRHLVLLDPCVRTLCYCVKVQGKPTKHLFAIRGNGI